MICLGIEGTAHTLGIGIVDDDEILADVRHTYSPKDGGIHPRESSRYIADKLGPGIREALESAKISKDELDVVAFSKGPGLGACLANTAVGARALALSLNIPIIGVNHCVAHIEIGNMLAMRDHPDWAQPLTLYVSGANTQILMFKEGRYRVFGETLDIGCGNMLDKFGRAAGLPHPAGPKIEKLAKGAKDYIQLPYVVKGNDLSFSGILTESIKKLGREDLEDICYSLQETSFAMMAEATERALCHLKSNCILLTGGVANNSRLQEMIRNMAEDCDTQYSVPKGLCGDNGAMIAATGLVMHRSGISHDLAETMTDQNYRTDEVEIPWAKEGGKNKNITMRGAEAILRREGDHIIKKRNKKNYRIDELDESIRRSRTSREAKLLKSAAAAEIQVPNLYMHDKEEYTLDMEYLKGPALYDVIEDEPNRAGEMGEAIRRMHGSDIIHGDLTTSNMIIAEGKIHLIDFGLGMKSNQVEDKATDLLLFKKAIGANHSKHADTLWKKFKEAYGNQPVLKRLEIAERRGRYKH